MFYNADSGLYLANYRAFDPIAGRWLSRDPLGEPSDPLSNLYPYVSGNPVSFVDPLGLQEYYHHPVPRSVFDKQNLPPEAHRVFDKEALQGPVSLHQYDKAHRLYNEAAKELWERLLKEHKIDPSKMTEKQAQKIVDEFNKCKDPRMLPLRSQLGQRALRGRPPLRGSD
jgi:RHS repeat-associated protein